MSEISEAEAKECAGLYDPHEKNERIAELERRLKACTNWMKCGPSLSDDPDASDFDDFCNLHEGAADWFDEEGDVK